MTEQIAPPAGQLSAPALATDRSTSDWVGIVDQIAPARAARAVVLAVVAGIFAQLLVVNQAGGINAVLWVAFVLGAAVLVRRPGARIDRLDVWLPVAALIFAGFIALRDESMLFIFNMPMAGALTLAAVVALGGTPLTRRAAGAVAHAGSVAVLLAGLGAPFIGHGVGEIHRRVVPAANPGLSAVVRGVLVALPLLLVFIVLFSAADAIFATRLNDIVSVDLSEAQLPARIVVSLAAAWVFAGTLAAAWMARAGQAPAAVAGTGTTAATAGGRIEALVVLVLLDALFAVFVAIQAAYLFGGVDTLAAAGLGYADYARRGFFELVLVATVVGVVLLVVGRRVEGSLGVRAAAIALAVLTGFILFSAAMRLGLYQAAYGWSELRFYVLAAIVWLGACLVATIVALAISRSGWLLHAWLAAGFVVAIAVNVIGPQQFATARNVERAIDPSLVAADGWHGLDVEYISWFGADAVPVLLAARDRLPADDAAAVDQALREWAADLRRQARQVGWPSWNLSRETALAQLQAAGY